MLDRQTLEAIQAHCKAAGGRCCDELCEYDVNGDEVCLFDGSPDLWNMDAIEKAVKGLVKQPAPSREPAPSKQQLLDTLLQARKRPLSMRGDDTFEALRILQVMVYNMVDLLEEDARPAIPEGPKYVRVRSIAAGTWIKSGGLGGNVTPGMAALTGTRILVEDGGCDGWYKDEQGLHWHETWLRFEKDAPPAIPEDIEYMDSRGDYWPATPEGIEDVTVISSLTEHERCRTQDGQVRAIEPSMLQQRGHTIPVKRSPDDARWYVDSRGAKWHETWLIFEEESA